jgi:hypothetical protein
MSDGEPIAWAVLLADGDRIYDVYAIEEEAKAIDEVVTGNHGIVPLYRSPALTDAEREAVDAGADALESLASNDNDGRIRAALMIAANTLRGFLKRTG